MMRDIFSRCTRRACWLLLAGSVTLILGCSNSQSEVAEVTETPLGESESTEPEKTITGAEAYHGLLEYRAKDAKLALVQPIFAAADTTPLPAGVSVVGVSAGGVFRAYPLYILKNHQIVNDTLGGVPIAASW